jgi:hypothetical protein
MQWLNRASVVFSQIRGPRPYTESLAGIAAKGAYPYPERAGGGSEPNSDNRASAGFAALTTAQLEADVETAGQAFEEFRAGSVTNGQFLISALCRLHALQTQTDLKAARSEIERRTDEGDVCTAVRSRKSHARYFDRLGKDALNDSLRILRQCAFVFAYGPETFANTNSDQRVNLQNALDEFKLGTEFLSGVNAAMRRQIRDISVQVRLLEEDLSLGSDWIRQADRIEMQLQVMARNTRLDIAQTLLEGGMSQVSVAQMTALDPDVIVAIAAELPEAVARAM